MSSSQDSSSPRGLPSSGNGANGGNGNGRARSANELPQRLIILCDGTWEDRLQVMSEFQCGTNTSRPLSGQYYTNVALLNMAIPTVSRPDKNGKKWRQVCYYATGIGSGQLSLLAKAFTGATGSTLTDKLQQAYGFLCDNYQDGDEIFLFGFSRGSYTARAIAGFINWAGILKKASDFPTQDGVIINESVFFNEIFDAYEKREPGNAKSIQHAAQVLYDKLGRWPSEGADDTVTVKVSSTALSGKSVTTPTERAESGGWKNDEITVPPLIKVVGVWDTVGALGIPGFFQISKLYSFLDAGLSSNVQYAFQALALGEDRKDFLPTLWYKPCPSQIAKDDQRRRDQVMRQVWFCGSHGDVGGGNGEHGLSDISLAWMVAQLLESGGKGDPTDPLLDVNVDVLKFLQDRRRQWGKQPPNPSRSCFTFQETRQVKAKPDQEDQSGVVWKNNVYTGLTAESIHHSVVVSGRYSPDSPQFKELKARNPELLTKLWEEAGKEDSLSPTEKLLQWGETQGEIPQAKRPNLLFRAVLQTIKVVSNVSAVVIADVINLRIIPKEEQVNLKVVLADWADKKLRGEQVRSLIS